MLELPAKHGYEVDRESFRLDVPEDFNFGFDVIGARAREANKTAYIYVDRSGTTIEHHSFDDLDRRSNRFARVLLGMEVAPGDHALVMIPRLPAWYEVLVGCMKAGVVAMPATIQLTPKDIAYRINKSRARIVIVTADHASKVDDIRAECPSLEHAIIVGGEAKDWVAYEAACQDASDRLERGEVASNLATDPMLVYFTSGTTSLPKMVPRDHAYALAHVITGHYWMDLSERDIHWTLSDTGWAKAAWGMLFPQWLVGATVVLYDGDPHFDAHAHLSLIEKLGVTTFCAPPTVYRLFAQSDLAAYNLDSIRHSLSAGEPLNPEVIRVWEQATGTQPHDGYGQTETINIVANYPGVPIRPGSMGKPVPGLDVDIVDEEGNRLGDEQPGHIAVRVTDPYPPGLFRGYFEEPQANEKCFRNGWYYTGDTATRDGDGYIWFVGRADDIITSAGYRISPFEVESALQEHPAVAESAVIGKPDDLRGEIVKAFVILAPGHEASEELREEIQTFVKNLTAPYKYPREVEFRDSLPKTISGKIRRTELRAEARG